MATTLTIDTTELDALGTRLNGAGAIVQRESGIAMQRSVLAVQRGAQRAVPVDTGHLRRSITATVRPNLGTVGTNVPYAEAVDQGRRPNAPMPPGGALLRWMKRHGIEPEAEYIVRRAIGKRGIKATRFLTGTFARLRPQIHAEFRAAMVRAAKQIGGGR